MKEFKYKTTFSSQLKCLIGEDKDKYLAKASYKELQAFIPKIDLEANYDVLSVAFPLFNVNKFNRNDDGVGTESALAFYKTFINKAINLEHSRDEILGVILTANISDFTNDQQLEEKDIKETKGVFNISVGGILWRVVNPSLIDIIEQANDPSSEYYNKLHASFEIAFDDLNIYAIEGNSRNFEDGEILTDKEEIEAAFSKLRANGGSGKLDDGRRVYRELTGSLVGLGAGIVESPAGFLNPIAVKASTETTSGTSNSTTVLVDINLNDENKISQNQNKISHLENRDVIANKNEQDLLVKSFETKDTTKQDMKKITKLQDITDEALKEVKATAIVDFIEEELKKASEEYTKEKTEKESLVNNLENQRKVLAENYEVLTKKLESLQVGFDKLAEEKVAKENLEVFNCRMASFDEKFELTNADRKIIAANLRNLTDEQYKEYETNMSVLLASKDKETLEKLKNEKNSEETKASNNTETDTVTVVDDALKNAKDTTASLPNAGELAKPTLKERMAKVFVVDECIEVRRK